MFRLIVSGTRHQHIADQHRDLIRAKLMPYWLRHAEQVTLVHGQCPYGGVDLITDQIGTGWGWTIERHPPEIRDGRILGPARDTHMVARGAGQVEAFPAAGTRGRGGTWNLIHTAADAGIPTHIWPLTTPRSR